MPAMNVAVAPRGLSSVGALRPIAPSSRSARVAVRRSVVVRADSVDDAVSTITSGVQVQPPAPRSWLSATAAHAQRGSLPSDADSPFPSSSGLLPSQRQ